MLVVSGVVGCSAGSAAAEQPVVSNEYAVKAAFLYNFTKFVEWPPQHFANETAPIRIGVFGHNPFGDGLRAIVANRVANGRVLEIVELRTDEAPTGVDLVFVSAAEEKRFAALQVREPAAGILTVGESGEFGGVITFVPEGDKIRFAINVAAAERAGLKVSSKLLSVALTVKRGGPRQP